MTDPGRDNESRVHAKAAMILESVVLFGCVAAGLIGIAGAVLGMDKTDGRYTGGGVYLVGAAIAFGALTNAMLRK